MNVVTNQFFHESILDLYFFLDGTFTFPDGNARIHLTQTVKEWPREQYRPVSEERTRSVHTLPGQTSGMSTGLEAFWARVWYLHGNY